MLRVCNTRDYDSSHDDYWCFRPGGGTNSIYSLGCAAHASGPDAYLPQMAVDYCGDLLSRRGSSPVASAGSPARRANP